MTRSRLELLQWYGLLAGPLAWAGQHVAMLYAVYADCNPAGRHWSVPQHAIVAAATGVALVAVVTGALAAYLAYRATDGVDKEGDPPAGRIRFLSMAALVVGPLFFALVALDGAGNLSHSGCVQG